MKKFSIGEVYCLAEYEYKNANSIDDEKTIVVQISSEASQKLAKQLKQKAAKIEEAFNAKKIEVQEYQKKVDKLQKLKEAKAKTEERKNLEKEIVKLKKKIFQKKSNKSNLIQQANLVMRNYIPENMVLSDTPVSNGTYVMYAGPDITQNGKIIHRWYNLSPTKILAEYLDTEAEIFEYV